ncbi:MAG: hypothetical protein KDD73_16130 [Anaerolineales bacterium]|nr:hypothetical protein [Anaerolineales bacterium]
MDLLDGIDLGGKVSRGSVRRAFYLLGALLVAGWTWRWPVIHPLVQGVIDQRVENFVEIVRAALEDDR